MTTNARFLYDDYASGSTITALGEATQFPATNAGVDFRQVPYRSLAVAAQQWLQFTTSSSIAPTGVAIVDHNISSGATVIRVQSSTTSNFSGGTQTTLIDLTWRDGIIFGFWAASTARLYHRLLITDTGNTDGYIQIGRVLLGLVFEPTRSYRMGFGRNQRDLSVTQEAMNGVKSSVVKPALDGYPLQYRIPNSTDLANWKTWRDKVQTARPFVWIPQGTNLDGSNSGSGPLDDALWCRNVQPIALPNVFNANSSAMVVLEESA